MAVPRVGFIASILMNHITTIAAALRVSANSGCPVPSIYGPVRMKIVCLGPPFYTTETPRIGPSTYFGRSGTFRPAPEGRENWMPSTLIDFDAYRGGGLADRIKPLWKRLDSLRKNTLSDLQG